MQVRVSPEVGALLDEAVAVSARRGTRYVGVQHLFEAVVSAQDALPEVLKPEDVSALHQAVEGVYRDACPIWMSVCRDGSLGKMKRFRSWFRR